MVPDESEMKLPLKMQFFRNSQKNILPLPPGTPTLTLPKIVQGRLGVFSITFLTEVSTFTWIAFHDHGALNTLPGIARQSHSLQSVSGGPRWLVRCCQLRSTLSAGARNRAHTLVGKTACCPHSAMRHDGKKSSLWLASPAGNENSRLPPGRRHIPKAPVKLEQGNTPSHKPATSKRTKMSH